MSHYIQVAYCDNSRPKYIPVQKEGYILIETFRSIFSKATGMFFNFEGREYVVKLHEGNFYPPINGWGQRLYFPMFVDDDEHYGNDDDYCGNDDDDDDEHYENEDDGYYDEHYYEERYYDDYTEDNGYNGQPQQYNAPEKEDINDVYLRMMREKEEEESYEEDYDD